MVYYFHGSDTYAARQAIGELAHDHSAVIHWLDKEDFANEAPAHWFSHGSNSLFGSELIVLRDPSQFTAGLREEIAKALANSATLVVIWERVRLDKNDLLYRQYRNNARVFSVPAVSEVINWLKQEAVKQNGSIADNAAKLMVERISLDKWQLKSELDKLLLLHSSITIPDIEQTIAPSPEAEIFSVLDALTGGRPKAAIAGIQTLLNSGSSELYILSMLAYQFRSLLLIRSGQDRGLKQFDIVKEGKLKTYTVQKNWQPAAKKPFAYWLNALIRILATDFSIKQGKLDGRTAVMMLTLNLASR